MRVRVFRNLGLGFPPLRENEEAEVEDAIGNKIVSLGLGLDCSPTKPVEIKMVPPMAELKTTPKIEDSAVVTSMETDPKDFRRTKSAKTP